MPNISLKQFREKHGVSPQTVTAMKTKTPGFPATVGTCFEMYKNGYGSLYRKQVPTFDADSLEEWYSVAAPAYTPSTWVPKPVDAAIERFDNAMARLFMTRADVIRPRLQANSGKTRRISTREYGYESF